MSKPTSAVKNRYAKKAYDQVRYIVPAGGKIAIQSAAEKAGQSVTQYITQAVNARMISEGLEPIKAYVAEQTEE